MHSLCSSDCGCSMTSGFKFLMLWLPCRTIQINLAPLSAFLRVNRLAGKGRETKTAAIRNKCFPNVSLELCVELATRPPESLLEGSGLQALLTSPIPIRGCPLCGLWPQCHTYTTWFTDRSMTTTDRSGPQHSQLGGMGRSQVVPLLRQPHYSMFHSWTHAD